MGVRRTQTRDVIRNVGDRPRAPQNVAVIGGGPSGMTTALLLARAGHRVVLYERGRELGGLWASALAADGTFLGDNSCKVYQASYRTAPALFRLIGTSWKRHFTARHDLTHHWLKPFFADCSLGDLARLGGAFALEILGVRSYTAVSVADWMETNHIGEPCRRWMRATALGGIAGTLRMTMWELFHRLRGNLGSLLSGGHGTLYWNTQPPNSPEGFVAIWAAELKRLGVEVRCETPVSGLTRGDLPGISIETEGQPPHHADAVFLAMPPPALSQLLRASSEAIGAGFGHDATRLHEVLRESVYEHLGMAWHFDRPLPTDLPLGGHNVRRHWHPILVQHDQYRPYLRAPVVSVVTGSVSVDTDFLHERLATLASDYDPAELARILWEDERRIDPTLPEPIGVHVFGVSSATQIVHHGPLPIKAAGSETYLSTNLNGRAPYFTSSLESAIQAGAAAAAAFDPRVERLIDTG